MPVQMHRFLDVDPRNHLWLGVVFVVLKFDMQDINDATLRYLCLRLSAEL